MAEELWRVSEELTREYLVSHDGPDLNEIEKGWRRLKNERK